MSHFTTIETQIRDMEALKTACAEMGLELTRGEARGYSGATHHGEHVIRLKGPYDIALNRQKDGSYGFTADWWQGHVEKEVGPKYGRLLQLYAVHKTMREARRKGLTARREAKADGSIKLTLGGMS